MNNNIIKQAQTIAQTGIEADLEAAQQLLMSHLIIDQYDTDAWLLLARLECNPPLYDQDRIIHYAQHVLSYDPSNAYALLLWSYADHHLMGNEDDNLYERLCMAHSDNNEIMSMVEVAKAWHFELRNINKYEKALKKSIEYCSTHTKNQYMLGELYMKQGKTTEGQAHIERGHQNIKILNKCENIDNWKLDYVTIESLLDEFFSGIDTNDIIAGRRE